MGFLPVSLVEARQSDPSFTAFDVVFVTGDPYYDHPLSGIAILSRLLVRKGYSVGIVPQPETDEEFMACGRPRYLFCITSGLLDSMLANYTPMLKPRQGIRVPERALQEYTSKVKHLFPGAITAIGGVEATIRRFTHFDYKDNELRRGILNDTKADMLLFGTAERALLTILSRLKGHEGERFAQLQAVLDLPSIEGVAFRVRDPADIRVLPSFEDCVADKEKFNLLTRTTYLLPDGAFIEPCGKGMIRHNRPEHTLTEAEMDVLYSAPFTRQIHPDAKDFAFNQDMVAGLSSSVIIGRGCWGSCNFCVIPLVQGKEVAKRSPAGIVREIEALYADGVKKINDLTLPTLNMYGSRCALYKHESELFSPIIDGPIKVYDKVDYCNQQCVGCPYRVISDDLMPILEEVEKLNQKYAGTSMELRSALRHDIILGQKALFRKIMRFVSRLKIAPEHLDDMVLKQMNKATRQHFVEFLKEYKQINEEQGTKKNLVPYLIAAHPGSTKESMREMKRFCDDEGLFVSLTQVFTPTPGTVSTAMYYTGVNPLTRERIHVPRTFREKKDQKNILLASDEELVDDNA